MDNDLASLVDHVRIVACEAAPVPAGPNWRCTGELLFVNCHYHVRMIAKPAAELLQAAKRDALEILSRVATRVRREQYSAAVVTIYGHFPIPGAPRPARRRIYRVVVLSSNLPTDFAGITQHDFAQLLTEEGSELDALADLIHHTAT